ncbi:MAG: LanC-like protein [Burkholderiaceae bacterium]
MLHDPTRHEPLADTAWDAEAARAAVAAIVRELEDARLPDGGWPVHPLDEAGDTPPGGFKGMYLGRAGLLWALGWLREAGLAAPRLDLGQAIDQAVADYAAAPDSGDAVPSYFLGEAGLRLVQWRLTGSAAAAERLRALVEANIAHPSNEALWGSPGTMLAAWHLWRHTGDDAWRTLYRRNARHQWDTWHWHEPSGCHLWTQDLYGKVVQYLGAGHGFAGNAFALLLGAELLDADQRRELPQRVAQALACTARHEGQAANWRPGLWAPRPGSPEMLMQWCHGAPGIVTATQPLPPGTEPALDALLCAAGEAVWQAGPLAKGPSLCHGTAGNGMALLALHARTADPTWLARARRFAMHAIAQVDTARHLHGHGRHSLWTGDVGVAVFLAQCLDGTYRGMPLLDVV